MVIATYAKLAGYRLLAEDDVVEARQALCDPCPFRDEDRCSVCTCDIEAKTRLNTEKCPKRKWSRVWTKI
jgi:hypothetical protein